MADKNKYINASPLDRKIQKNITKAQTKEKKQEESIRNSRKVQKARKETYDRMAAQENEHRKDINKIIKEQGYYNGPNGEHYEKKLKMIDGDYYAKQNNTKILRPSKTTQLGLLNRIEIAIANMISKIRNSIVNMFERGPREPEYDVAVRRGNPMAGVQFVPQNSPNIVQPELDTDDKVSNNIYKSEEKSDVINAKKEFQYWMNRNRINDKAPRDIVFDFMKAATLQNLVTDEKGISDILTYAMENKCEYHPESGETLMYFQLKNGVGVIGVDDKGNIFTPETVTINNESTKNPITMESLADKMPEKVSFLSEQIKQSPNLLQQFTNKDGFSRTDLQQVKEYLDKQGVDTYNEHITAIENKFVDRNAIRAFNEFVTRASFMGTLQRPDDVINFALIKPAQTMSNMANPAQYSPIFSQACDQLVKGLSQNEAIAVAETLLLKKNDELTIAPQEVQKVLVAHIDELQKHGIAAPEVIGIIQSYNASSPTMAEINKQLITMEMDTGKSIKDIIATKRDTDVDIASIAAQIGKEIENKTHDAIVEDVNKNGNHTVTGIYLSNLRREDVLLVAQQMPEGDKRDTFMIAAGLKSEERISNNNEVIEDATASSSVIADDDISL